MWTWGILTEAKKKKRPVWTGWALFLSTTLFGEKGPLKKARGKMTEKFSPETDL